MKETNEHGYTLNFMDECDYDLEKKNFFATLEVIEEFKNRQVPIILEYCQVQSPEKAYIRKNMREISPIYSATDGYGKFHIWKDGDNWKAGVEIEVRYILSDELSPQIKEYDVIPDSVQFTIQVLRKDLDR
jgi:hypothetical protein